MASNPSAAKRKFPADAADAPLMVATDARVLAKLPCAALAAWCLPERLWDGLAYCAAGLETTAIDQLARRITAMAGPGDWPSPRRCWPDANSPTFAWTSYAFCAAIAPAAGALPCSSKVSCISGLRSQPAGVPSSGWPRPSTSGWPPSGRCTRRAMRCII